MALLSTGCRLGMELVVNPDGSVETRSILIFTADDLAQIVRVGGTTGDLCSGLDPSGGAMVQEARGDEIACVATRAFGSLDELNQGDESLVINTVRVENSRFVYDADLTLAGDTGDGLLDMSDLQVQALFQEIYFRITAPGAIDEASSNANSYEGNAATWYLSFGETRNIHLESAAP